MLTLGVQEALAAVEKAVGQVVLHWAMEVESQELQIRVEVQADQAAIQAQLQVYLAAPALSLSNTKYLHRLRLQSSTPPDHGLRLKAFHRLTTW